MPGEIVVLEGEDMFIKSHKNGYCSFLIIQLGSLVVFSIFIWNGKEAFLSMDGDPDHQIYFDYTAVNMSFYVI